jgi:hypothetical protein
MRILSQLVVLLLWSSLSFASNYYMNPLNLRQGFLTNDCTPPDDWCIFTGIYLGLQNGPASTHAPEYFVGSDVDQRAQGAGDVTSMTGDQLYSTCDTGGTCSYIFGVDSRVFDGHSSPVTNIYHFSATEQDGAPFGTSYGLYYYPGSSDTLAYSVYSDKTIAQLYNAGPANLGKATSTPGATPTATSATATATAVTPTPTPTSTPRHLIKEDVAHDGNIVQVGNAPRSMNVGPCTRSPCAGKAQTFSSGPATTDGVGGSQDLSSGAGANLKNAGDMTRTIGAGGGNIVDTARRGFLNTGGLYKIFADFILGVAAGGSRPTFGAGCGSTASDALATNNQGRITMSGTGQTGSCVVTFANGGFANTPRCFAQFSVDGGVAGHGIKTAVETTTTLTINNAVLATGVAQNFAANDVVKYWCVGTE